MDIGGVVLGLLRSFWWLIPFLLLGLFLGSSFGKGIVGELLVRFSLRRGLDRDVYHKVHDVTLMTATGTTQIDHVVVSPFGVFVIETKNMKGWIFGRETDANWTQSIYGNKRRFENPIRQNYKHVKAIEELLGVPASTIHSVVVFIGDAELKTPMPEFVTKGTSFIGYIRKFYEPVFAGSEVDRLVQRLGTGRLPRTWAVHRAHVKSLNARFENKVAPRSNDKRAAKD